MSARCGVHCGFCGRCTAAWEREQEPPSDQVCEDCGADATANLNLWAVNSDEVYWMRCDPYIWLCADCWDKRDNDEPPDPDGEAFRGEEAAAFEREQMAVARRLK